MSAVETEDGFEHFSSFCRWRAALVRSIGVSAKRGWVLKTVFHEETDDRRPDRAFAVVSITTRTID